MGSGMEMNVGARVGWMLEGEGGASGVCVRKRGWIISGSLTTSLLWVKDWLLWLNFHSLIQSVKLYHSSVSTWDLHLQNSPKRTGHLTLDLLRE